MAADRYDTNTVDKFLVYLRENPIAASRLLALMQAYVQAKARGGTA